MHHTHKEHHQFEENMQIELEDSRRKMLNVKKEERRYKFNNSEYKISRRMMIIRVSKILSQRISFFMKRILDEGKGASMEEIRESSLLFKE